MTDPHIPLVYAHVGDLHLTTEDRENYRDWQRIVEALGALSGGLDFVYLPGDNADNGTPEQYELVRRELARLALPVHVITGDHDVEQGSLDAFYTTLGATPLPKAVDAGGCRCLFLDISGPGTGGPDFRMGVGQMDWLRAELAEAARLQRRCVVFMHTYPADLRGEGETETLNTLFAEKEVLLVDMGHTHYNELANDGRTIFSATRSTGQIEEGPVGFSLVAIDGRAVSWRFRTLDATGPAVLVTAPVDRRLAVDADYPDHLPGSQCEVRATILSPRPITRCMCRIDGGAPIAMQEVRAGRYAATLDLPADATTLTVEAEADNGGAGHESIDIARSVHLEVARRADGSDGDAVEAWPARGILGTQLGPNRNGRKW